MRDAQGIRMLADKTVRVYVLCVGGLEEHERLEFHGDPFDIVVDDTRRMLLVQDGDSHSQVRVSAWTGSSWEPFRTLTRAPPHHHTKTSAFGPGG